MLLLQALRSSSTSLRLRQFAHAVPPITVTKIKLLEKEKVLLVTFGSGETCRLPAEYLRIESPAAGNQDSRDASGRLKVRRWRRPACCQNWEDTSRWWLLPMYTVRSRARASLRLRRRCPPAGATSTFSR